MSIKSSVQVDNEYSALELAILRGKKTSKIAVDSVDDPFWDQSNELYKEGYSANRTTLQPAEYVLTQIQKRASAYNSPKGHFITFVCCMDAFRNKWKHIKPDSDNVEVEAGLDRRLRRLRKDYELNKIHTFACATARMMGKALVIKLPRSQMDGRRRRTDVRLRVIPIDDQYIIYNDYGEPILFKPVIPWGRGYKQLTITPADCELYVHKTDPFGNGFQGIPETLPVYPQLTWMANIERGWAEAMDSRGISMLHFSIEGFELEDSAKWKNAYGKPSSYNVIFTDKETDVKEINGVKSTFNLDDSNDAFTKDVASASGMAMSRIDGTQRGQVTGSQTDTDNYFAILSSIQEDFEYNLIGLYEMIDPTVIDKFEIGWVLEPKMDSERKAALLATNLNAIQIGQDFMTYNQARKLLGYEEVEGGDEIASVYIHNLHSENGMFLEVPQPQSGEKHSFEPKEEKKQEPINMQKELEKKKKKSSTRQSQMKEPIDTEEDRGGERGESTEPKQCKAKIASGRQCLNFTTDPSGYCYVHKGGKVGGVWGSKLQQKEIAIKGKKRIAEAKKREGDSYRTINADLVKLFGSGLSNTDIREIDKMIRENDKQIEGLYDGDSGDLVGKLKVQVASKQMEDRLNIARDLEYWIHILKKVEPKRNFDELLVDAYERTIHADIMNWDAFGYDSSLSDCVAKKIPIIVKEHPEMKKEQVIAIAYSYCKKKGVKDQTKFV